MHHRAARSAFARLAAVAATVAAVALPLALATPAEAQRWFGGGPGMPCWNQDGSWNQEACPWQPGQGPGMGMGPGMGPGTGSGWGPRMGYGPMPFPAGPQDGAQPWHRGMMGGGWGMRRGMGVVDANGDGVISADEAAAMAEAAFDRLDADGGGRMSRDAFMDLPSMPMMPTHMQAMLSRHEARFKAMDTNGDGFIDHAEWLTWHAARYQAADLNKDGKVGPWEFRIAMRRP